MIYADSSFIISCYVPDANSPQADKFNAEEHRLPFTFLHWPEVAKALWTSHPARAESVWDELKRDIIIPALALSTTSGQDADYFDGRIGLEFFDARGLLLFVPSGGVGNIPIFSPAFPPAISGGGWYSAEDDRFLGDPEEGEPTVNSAKASQVTVACLPVIAGGFPDEHARVEYSATRFLAACRT